jgi:hypothetical protein
MMRFGKWTVIGAKIRKGNLYYYPCECKCGTKRDVSISSLKDSKSRSCGCENYKNPLKHGFWLGGKTKSTYNSWASMIQRCYNINNTHYKDYGGRGIAVCKRWLKFENFLKDMGECPEGMSIHRKDNDGNYELANCKWATDKEQGANKRNSVILTLNGESHHASEWARIKSWSVATIYNRKRRGWPDEEALTTLPSKHNHRARV